MFLKKLRTNNNYTNTNLTVTQNMQTTHYSNQCISKLQVCTRYFHQILCFTFYTKDLGDLNIGFFM